MVEFQRIWYPSIRYSAPPFEFEQSKKTNAGVVDPEFYPISEENSLRFSLRSRFSSVRHITITISASLPGAALAFLMQDVISSTSNDSLQGTFPPYSNAGSAFGCGPLAD